MFIKLLNGKKLKKIQNLEILLIAAFMSTQVNYMIMMFCEKETWFIKYV
jgi:hypothetical protein